MTGRSHLLLGIVSYGAIASCGWMTFSLPGILTAALGSLTPDLDTERSLLGVRLKWISRPLSRLCGHRTVTHSLLLPLIVAGFFWYEGRDVLLSGPLGAFLTGYVSHILGDLVTGGCAALYPLARGRIAFWPYAKVGSFREYLLLLSMISALSCLTYRNLVHQLALPSISGHATRTHHTAFIALNGKRD